MKTFKHIINSDKFINKALIAFVVRAVGVGFAFLLNVLVARLLGAEAAGVFYLSLTLMMTAGFVVRFGLDVSLIRFVSTSIVNKQYKLLMGYFFSSILLVVFLGLLVGSIVYLLSEYIDAYLFPRFALSSMFSIIVLGLIPISLLWVFSGVLKGMKRSAQASFIESAGLPFVTIIFLLGTNFAGFSSPEVALMCYTMAAIVTSIIGIKMVLNGYPVSFEMDIIRLKELLHTSFPMMLVALMGFVVMWSPSLFLGVFTDSVSVALYNISFRTAALISFILVVVNSIASPRFAEYYDKGDIDEIELLAIKSNFLMLALISPLVFIILVWPEFLLSLFGPEFIEAKLILKIIVIGQVVNVLTGSVGHLLMMTGHQLVMRNIMIFTLCFSLVLNYFLVTSYGVIGVAISVSISLSVQNLLMVWFAQRKLGIYVLPGYSSFKKITARN